MRAPGASLFCVVGMVALGCHSHPGMRVEAGADLGAAGSSPMPDGPSPGTNPDTPPPEASPDASADVLPGDAKVKSTILGRCTVDDDCLPVLDYRAGFICLAPVAASKEDMAVDPCLVPWWPNAICSTALPPSTCVGGVGRIPVNHSCLVLDCQWPVCRAGQCGLAEDLTGARCYQPKDCDSLRAVYLNALAAAHTCYPVSARCANDLKDPCGCAVAYDMGNRCADSAVAASKAWRDAGCSPGDCDDGCPSATGASSTCVADAVGTNGTCQL